MQFLATITGFSTSGLRFSFGLVLTTSITRISLGFFDSRFLLSCFSGRIFGDLTSLILSRLERLSFLLALSFFKFRGRFFLRFDALLLALLG